MGLRSRMRTVVPIGLFAGVVVSAVGLAFATAAAPQTASPLGRDEAEALVRAHNAQRREVGAPPLAWAPDLARLAEARAERLAEKCRLAHQPLPAGIGENLLLALPESSGGEVPAPAWPTAAQVVEAWAGERSHYSHDRNRCAAGRDCLHYTQIVWAATREVGCATATCATGGRVWACDYRPAGNIEGQRPY